jgi:hypothetical protein
MASRGWIPALVFVACTGLGACKSPYMLQIISSDAPRVSSLIVIAAEEQELAGWDKAETIPPLVALARHDSYQAILQLFPPREPGAEWDLEVTAGTDAKRVKIDQDADDNTIDVKVERGLIDRWPKLALLILIESESGTWSAQFFKPNELKGKGGAVQVDASGVKRSEG